MIDQIFIRVDGNVKLGVGHLIRCIGLAHMLKSEFIIHFFCVDVPSEIAEEINKEFTLNKISSEQDFVSKITGDEIVIIDHYDLGSSYQKKIKNLGAKLVCIDDSHDEEFFADLIINHSPAVTPENYLAQDYTTYALGPEYALLRPAYFRNYEVRSELITMENVFICFGGADSKNISKLILEVVSSFEYFKKITVVIGPAYQYENSLKDILENDSRIELMNSINEVEMASAMSSSGLAIVPASNVLFEVAVKGAQPIICFYGNSQDELYQYLTKNSNAFCLNVYNFDRQELIKAIENSLEINPSEAFFLREKVANSPSNNLKNFRRLAMP